MTSLTITRPDDFHLHLRDGREMASVVAASARCFARAVIMPNLRPPVVTAADALAYRARILEALGNGHDFQPLMTLYLTEATTPAQIREAAAGGTVLGVKLYPAGATTHSDAGVRQLENTWPVLEAMEKAGLPLLVHGEVTDPDVDPFDREAVFLDRVLAPLVDRFQGLKVVVEHVTTAEAVDFVRSAPARVGATLTVHHLIYSRADLFRGGIRPHYYCLPLLKRERHRQALVEAATSGHERFFLGTDSAPHDRSAKEAGCGCAGIYSAPVALELYARVFEEAGALDRLNAFASVNGARFYGLPANTGTITLERREWRVPETLPFGNGEVVPLAAGETCRWQVKTS